MVGAVEAVVMMTMAAAPGMAMAVVTVTPAVGVNHIHLAVVSEWAGRRGAQLPLSREVTLLVIRTAAQVVVGHVVAVVAIEQIEEWLGADTELDLETTLKPTLVSVHSEHVFWEKSDKTNWPCLNLWMKLSFELFLDFPSFYV